MCDRPRSHPPEQLAFTPEQLWPPAASVAPEISLLLDVLTFQSLDKNPEHLPELAASIPISNSYPRSCKLVACRCPLLELLGFCFLNEIN